MINTYVNAQVFLKLGFVDCFPIVQLDFSYQLIVAGSPSTAAALAVGTVVDTTSANATVFLPLDNYASSGTEGTQVLTPIGLSTITVNDPLPATTCGGDTVLETRAAVSSSSSGQRPFGQAMQRVPASQLARQRL
jgi:hypothetical protein